MTMAEKDSSDSDGPMIDDNIIRIQLRKSSQRKWELRTRNLSPGIRFPTIQLFDCDGNLLVETNDENLSIKSSEFDDCLLRTSKSLKEKGFRHVIHKPIKKHNTISGDKVYTRLYRNPHTVQNNVSKSYVIKDSDSVTNIPSKLTVNGYNVGRASLDTTPFHSEGPSEVSSYKSSDNETCEDINRILKITDSFRKREKESASSINCSVSSLTEHASSSNKENEPSLHKSQSFNDASLKGFPESALVRSKSGVKYDFPHNKVSFLNTYLKSLPVRADSNPEFTLQRRTKVTSSLKHPPKLNEESASDNDPSIAEVNCEMKKRLKMYRRGISEIEPKRIVSLFAKRSNSVSGMTVNEMVRTSSSESVDEADVVLNRLKRRILRNKLREKRRSLGAKFQFKYVEEGCYEAVVQEMETNRPAEPTSDQQLSVDSENIIAVFKDALGVEYVDDSKFEGKIQTEITKRWNHILVNGLTKEEKDIIIKKYKLPDNCQLLEAPILNEEVKTVMTESSKLRDRSLEMVQHQLGLATAIVGQVMTNLIENKEINKIELVTKLTDASKLLNDINFQKTKTRRNLIAPLLDKNFNYLIEKVKRDEHLYGIDLGTKIKTSQELKKSSLQIKKNIPRLLPNKPAQKYKAVGNRYGPPQTQFNQQSRVAAPRGGPRNRATQPPPRRAAPSHSYSRSRPERAAPRGPHSKR